MNKWLFLLPILFLTACFTRSAMMTEETFAVIQIGEPYKTLEKNVGEPYAFRRINDNTIEYEYIERIYGSGRKVVFENHYFITVQDGIVTSKRFVQRQPPAYDTIYSDEPNFSVS